MMPRFCIWRRGRPLAPCPASESNGISWLRPDTCGFNPDPSRSSLEEPRWESLNSFRDRDRRGHARAMFASNAVRKRGVIWTLGRAQGSFDFSGRSREGHGEHRATGRAVPARSRRLKIWPVTTPGFVATTRVIGTSKPWPGGGTSIGSTACAAGASGKRETHGFGDAPFGDPDSLAGDGAQQGTTDRTEGRCVPKDWANEAHYRTRGTSPFTVGGRKACSGPASLRPFRLLDRGVP